ncbi:MAG: tRNA lysidine(34) synthetase TilS [Eubacteriales bacterium]
MRNIDAVKKSIIENKLIHPDEHVGVAVSGGADSVFLLHALFALKEELKVNITALHLEHGIRGHASRKDMMFVKALCDSLGIPLLTECVDTPTVAKKKGWSIEQAARELRYDFFMRMADAYGLDKIALAHHMDDGAETVLFNLTRGCGMQGLLGMRPFRPPLYIRPMLDMKKQVILTTLKEEKIKYRVDRTNKKTFYARNRIRHSVLPQLKKINPMAEQNIARTSEALSVEDEYINVATEAEYHKRVSQNGEEVLLSLDSWQTVHLALKRRIIRRVLDMHYSLIDVEFIHIDSIIGISLSENGKRFRMLGDVTVAKAYDKLSFFRNQETQYTSVDLKLSEETSFEYAGYQFDISWPSKADFGKDAECLAADGLHGAVLRIPEPEDYIVPLGMTGKKRLSDYLSDRKVPLHRRKNLPVLAKGAEILMVTGVGISEKVKISEKTRQICRIRFRKI